MTSGTSAAECKVPGDGGVLAQVCSLEDKVALITGASSGIGAGTALLFARLGAQLALNGRDMDKLSKLAKECEECGGKKVKKNIIQSP